MSDEKKHLECPDGCGACCEVLWPLVFGEDCPQYNKETKKCMDYENRPDICRTDVDKHGLEVYNNECERLRSIQEVA